MNLYSKKQRWKILLMMAALLIVGASLWYTGRIAENLRKEEIRKVEQWASDIRINIIQLNLADQSFKNQRAVYSELKQRERKDVERWAAATKELSREQLDYTFLIGIIQENNNIPVILTDNNNEVSSIKNTGFERNTFKERYSNLYKNISTEKLKEITDSAYKDTLSQLINEWKKHYQPIEITVMGSIRNRVYYRESDLLLEFDQKIEILQRKSDSLFNEFNQRLTKGNPLVPMIFIDDSTQAVIATNLKIKPDEIPEMILQMRSENDSIPVFLDEELKGYIFYKNSELLAQLQIFPYIQFGIIGLFTFIAYLMFSTFRNAEQNQVWVGMAKETAHQLGTPISSLMAWTELLKDQGISQSVIDEMNKDLQRLETVSDRFSKIGSAGSLVKANVAEVAQSVADYLQRRISNKVSIKVEALGDTTAQINVPLMAWVFENLAKNSVDAMEGSGSIHFNIFRENDKLIVDIKDTGKGIPAGKFKTVFRPGYTTKTRGWGLGLALVKRIVSEYHRGKIFVKESEPGKGTVFRLVLRA